MPINAYTGLMRSGKSYEVVSQVILPAILAGRRVVTNVDGISESLIHAYLLKKNPKAEASKLGTILYVPNEEVFKQKFFPHYDDKKSAVVDTVVQPGDLVAIDEAWRFWGTDCKLLKEHKSFFLEHGHFTHPETFVACDLVVMVQDIGTLHRFIRSVLAFSFRTHKKITLGLDRVYSIEMWEGAKQTNRARISSQVRSYQKEIFPLYSSFKGGAQGKVVNVDKRQNIFSSKKVLFALVVTPLVGFLSVYGLYYVYKRTVNRFDAGPVSAKDSVVSSPAPYSSPSSSSSPSSRLASSTGDVRVVGDVVLNGRRFIVVDDGGVLRFSAPENFVGSGVFIVGTVDGRRAAAWGTK